MAQARRTLGCGSCHPILLLAAVAAMLATGAMVQGDRRLLQHADEPRPQADAVYLPPAPASASVSIIVSTAASCRTDGTALMIATQTSVDTSRGASGPTGMACADVPGGLVLQVEFALQPDADALYNSLATTSGMIFWIANARSTSYLPCDTTALVFLNQTSLSRFSCTSQLGLATTSIPALCCTPSPSTAPPAADAFHPVDFPHACLPGNSAINGGLSNVTTETAGFAFTVHLTNVTTNSFEVNIRPNPECEPSLSGRNDCCNAQFKKTEFVIGNDCVDAIAMVESPGPSMPRRPSYQNTYYPGSAPPEMADNQIPLTAKIFGLYTSVGQTNSFRVTLKATGACTTLDEFLPYGYWWAAFGDTWREDSCCGQANLGRP
ncbi:hypothetical protein FOA52_010331 [Chlamydomonas sp. UWO 241]|nr:hypothetical protein FOA52_010331 [Chlamydomonas sp. UWO 241]